MSTYKLSPKFKAWYTVVVSFLALLLPVVLYLVAGSRGSLSQYADNTLANLIFSAVLLLIAHALTIRKLFTFPAVMMICIVAFDCYNYQIIHYIAAVLFFLSMGVLMSTSKTLSIYGTLMFINCLNLIGFGLYWFEIVGIILICLYNLSVVKILSGRIKENLDE